MNWEPVYQLLICYVFVLQWMVFWWMNDRIIRRSQHRAYSDQIISWHEAAHSILTFSCTNTSSFTDATIRAKNGGGITRWMFNGHKTNDDLWCEITIALAGIVGEHMRFGYNSYPNGDLVKAINCSTILLERNQLIPPWNTDEPTDFLKLETHKLYDDLPPEHIQIANYAAETARSIIKAYGRRTEILVDMLLKHKTIYEQDMEMVLGSRSQIRFAMHDSRFVVLPDIWNETQSDERRDEWHFKALG
jgi:hypothetical protein